MYTTSYSIGVIALLLLLSGCATTRPYEHLPEVLSLDDLARLTQDRKIRLTLTTGQVYTVRHLALGPDSTSFVITSGADRPETVATSTLEALRINAETRPGLIGVGVGLAAGLAGVASGSECRTDSCLEGNLGFLIALPVVAVLAVVGGVIGSRMNRSAPKGTFVFSREAGAYVARRVHDV